MPEAVHLGDLLRIWVRPGARFTPPRDGSLNQLFFPFVECAQLLFGRGFLIRFGPVGLTGYILENKAMIIF